MDCSAAEGMVSRYINHTLTVKEMEEFLEHVQNCSSCYEELETHFIVNAAIARLDEEEEESSLDIRNLLEQDLKKSRRYIYTKKAAEAFKAVFFVLLIAALIVLLVFAVMRIGQFI